MLKKYKNKCKRGSYLELSVKRNELANTNLKFFYIPSIQEAL